MLLHRFFEVSTPEEKEAFEVLYSFFLETGGNLLSYKMSPLLHKKYGKRESTIEEALGSAYYYLVLNNDVKEFKNYYHSIPQDLKIILYAFISISFLKMSSHTVLEYVSKIHPMSYLLSTYIELPKFLQDKSVDALFKTSSKSPKYPFKCFLFSNKAQNFKVKYLLKKGSNVTSNISSSSVRNLILRSVEDFSYGILILENRKKRRKNPKNIIIPLYKMSFDSLVDLLKGGFIDLDSLERFVLKGNKYISVRRIKEHTITAVGDFKDRYRRGDSVVAFAENGVFKLSFKENDYICKVVDYILDDNYYAVGYKYLYKGEVREIKAFVPDEVIEEGLEGSHIIVREFKLLDEVIYSKVIRAVISVTARECAFCGEITFKHRKQLCNSCFYQINNICKSNIKDYFIIKKKTFREGVEVNIEKYRVKFNGGSIVFKKDLEGIKGKQLSLPFKYPL
jgi:ribosomal protein L37E